jgi:rubrerythrin
LNPIDKETRTILGMSNEYQDELYNAILEKSNNFSYNYENFIMEVENKKPAKVEVEKVAKINTKLTSSIIKQIKKMDQELYNKAKAYYKPNYNKNIKEIVDIVKLTKNREKALCLNYLDSLGQVLTQKEIHYTLETTLSVRKPMLGLDQLDISKRDIPRYLDFNQCGFYLESLSQMREDIAALKKSMNLKPSQQVVF